MYPAIINLRDQVVTIVGGGKVALRKAKAFLDFGAQVTVISYSFEPTFETLEVTCVRRDYEELDLDQSFVVVAATNNHQVNEAIGKYCRDHRILCNVSDNPPLSSFISTAYMKRGDLVISVSTSGKSPSLARSIKKQLEEKYDDGYIMYLTLLGQLREKILATYTDEEVKKQKLKHLITLSLEELKAYEASHFDY